MAEAAVPEWSQGFQILTDTQGVDFTSYIQRLLATLRRNWYAVMPESAELGDKGMVYTTFQINRDGSVPSPDPTARIHFRQGAARQRRNVRHPRFESLRAVALRNSRGRSSAFALSFSTIFLPTPSSEDRAASMNRTQVIGVLLLASIVLLVLLLRYWKFTG